MVAFIMLCMLVLVVRDIHLQIINKQFLKHQGDMRQVDEVSVSAYRGMIVDRNGEPLAISTPVESVWIDPIDMKDVKPEGIRAMEKLLELPAGYINEEILNDKKRHIRIARQISPQLADDVKALKLEGVSFEREFKRYYPAEGVSAHIVGFTDINGVGSAGLEKRYEEDLRGTAGSKRVIRDGQRRIIDDVENIKEPDSGKTIELTIDQRIQYLAYKELQLAVKENNAKAGTVVVLDAKNGEILAAVNQPPFNPNKRDNLKDESVYRNRAFTEVFEPGSAVKPFIVAAALDSGLVKPNSIFPTNGTLQIEHNTVKDVHNYGTLDLTHVITKSSNVGVSMMALKMSNEYEWSIYHQLGFGVSTGLGFFGEATGHMNDHKKWTAFDRAVMSFGYGLNGSALQLARSYTALADDGLLHSVSLLKGEENDHVVRVFSAKTAKTVRKMMETVLTKEGTAYEARVDGYSAAGKTGTVKKVKSGGSGYTDKSYFAVFAGMAPVNDPRLIIVVMIDEPSAGKYYGGLVSAPVFSKVMAGALRILEVAPDQEETMPILLTQKK